MIDIQISEKAVLDIEEIWLYTYKQWGEVQADHYHDKLNTAFQQIAKTPKIGKAREEIRHGLRSVHIAKHIIYYHINSTYIYILRIRHDQTDPSLYED